MFAQLFDMINIGIVTVDRDMKVRHWNRWMEVHSGLPAAEIVGGALFDFFPHLDNQLFRRSCKSVWLLGNSCFFPHRRQPYLFPFKAAMSLQANFEYMQQNCTMGPLRDDAKQVQLLYITVEDISELVAYERKLLDLNMVDGLTKVRNRKYLEQQLQVEFGRHRRYGRPLSLIMMDLDFFKQVNDSHGHQCGDLVLQTAARELSSMVRETDTFARYGGEEFCCLLPETPLASAAILAERFRKKVEETAVRYNGRAVSITMSFGVAVAGGEVFDQHVLLRCADQALYEAKAAGRNKVVMMRDMDSKVA